MATQNILQQIRKSIAINIVFFIKLLYQKLAAFFLMLVNLFIKNFTIGRLSAKRNLTYYLMPNEKN